MEFCRNLEGARHSVMCHQGGIVSGISAEKRDDILSDEQILERVRGGETALFEILIRRHNRRLYRLVCAVMGGDHDAEDVMQEAYVRAYVHLDQFAGRASFATW